MKFYIVDAFTDSLFGGNPAGVVLIPEGKDFPSDEIMVKTAAELRYSETAFIQKTQETKGSESKYSAEYNVRYFTPAAEVDLCGHATIGTFYALYKAGAIKDGENTLAHTKAGDIEITVKDGFVMMDMAEPKHIATISDAVELDRLYDIMGSEYDQSLGLQPMLISTGLPDIMLPVSSEAELNAMKPDFPALARLSEAYNAVGVHAFSISEGDSSDGAGPKDYIECHTRNFAPLYEIDEEAATGTASGALTYYLCLNEKIEPHAKCKFIQGEAMDRPSEIITTIDAGETCLIRVGGRAAILAEGEINL